MEEGVLVRVVRMILWTRKGKIGRWKMTEVEQRTLGWDFGGGCMHKMVVKMKEHLPFCWESSILFIEDKVAVDRAVYLWMRSDS